MTKTNITRAPVSSAHINAQLAANASVLFQLECEAVDLSLSAVSGDAVAVQRLAEINARIERAKADKIILERARSAALSIEEAAQDEADEAVRQQHYAAAVDRAKDLVSLCERVDVIAAEFADLVRGIDAAERDISVTLRRAGHDPDRGVNWRRGLSTIAFANVSNCTATGDFRSVPVATRARAGWAALLNEDA